LADRISLMFFPKIRISSTYRAILRQTIRKPDKIELIKNPLYIIIVMVTNVTDGSRWNCTIQQGGKYQDPRHIQEGNPSPRYALSILESQIPRAARSAKSPSPIQN
jgi:hypothetical protein